MSDLSAQPFYQLTPDTVIDAVESMGYLSDGRILALNSYENRVYQVGIEEEVPLIAKFYRPARWSDAQILEEHEICFELVERELPVVAPLRNAQGDSLFRFGDYRFALYPRRGGRAPELADLDHLYRLGQTLGRIHLVGAAHPFKVRPPLDIQSYGRDSIDFISRNFIPASLRSAYTSLTADLLVGIERCYAAAGDVRQIRVHGDCHGGNILWRDDTPNFVDFDDARMAPAIQDLWMLLTGDDRQQQQVQLAEIVEGYNEFADFDPRELHLVEALRTLRMLNYSAWLARRWEDPAFPHNFTWFNTERYWGEHILQLREQLSALQQPPLQLL
ncbi:MAG: serine/threonine protein kinase [Oceanospirillales bacterium]|uniref:Stress response kinase A n=1 Tax=Marinobacterium halophilum TaxID=267374 RepID=A0A2P8ES40_9GAMM|nr:serine/threonine protein kinase [Marinobacterium halophilum]MBR9828227.1 serine/threonine protein kinase [Oceanospirillales bacterium]PSL12258.1 Ser/Thr protein kinase RdoA (MazF antagonist) [Marinobacterium halophilum]